MDEACSHSWLVEARYTNQRCFLELLRLGKSSALDSDSTGSDVFALLTGAAFSLWRVVPLSDVRGGPRFSDRLLRWSPDPTGGIWNATQETELPG